MNIIINSSHLPISEDVKKYVYDYVEKKFKKLEKFSSELTLIHLSLALEKLSHHAEITGHCSHMDLHVDATAKDLYKAIGLAVNKLIFLLKKHKSRHAPQLSKAHMKLFSKERLNELSIDTVSTPAFNLFE